MLQTSSKTLVSTAVKRGVFWVLISLLCLQSPCAHAQDASNGSQFSTISNGNIEVGIDLNGGGSIGYLSAAQSHGNVVNIHDFGRYIGQSYYSGPTFFGNPTGKWSNWLWNPTSAGDAFGHASQILSTQNDGKTIYVKSVPMQWALNNVSSECTFETWITLDNNAVIVDNRLVNSRSDKTQYSAKTQELPAVYTTGQLFRLFSYTGAQPFTGDSLTQIQNSGTTAWDKYLATESWAAAVDNTGWGLGVFHPGQIRFASGFVSSGWQPGTGGPFDQPTSYIGPLGREILDSNIVYTYRYYLVLGSLDQIRSYVYSKQQATLPNYVFASDRQHFYYNNATDSGWPIQGHLHVDLSQSSPQIIAPISAWRAEQVPNLFIRAAYNLEAAGSKATPGGSAIKGQVALQYLGSANYATPVEFTVIPDGKYHLYQINLVQNGAHHGIVTNMTINPIGSGAGGAGDSMDLMFVSNSAQPQTLTGASNSSNGGP